MCSPQAAAFPSGSIARCGGQRAGICARGGSRRGRSHRLRGLPDRPGDAPSLRRGPRQRARRSGHGSRSRPRHALQAAEFVDEFIGATPSRRSLHIAIRAAQHELPAGHVAAIDTRLRAHGASDRLHGVLKEWPSSRSGGLAAGCAPIGQILASQAIVHVLSAEPVPDSSMSCPRSSTRSGRPRGRSTHPARPSRSSPRASRKTDLPPTSTRSVATRPAWRRARKSSSCLPLRRGGGAPARGIRDRSSGEEACSAEASTEGRANSRDRAHRPGDRDRGDRGQEEGTRLPSGAPRSGSPGATAG